MWGEVKNRFRIDIMICCMGVLLMMIFGGVGTLWGDETATLTANATASQEGTAPGMAVVDKGASRTAAANETNGGSDTDQERTYEANSSILEEVRAIIKADYPLEIPQGVASAVTMSEMLEALGDPYAHYMSGLEFTNLMNGINMSFVGIGVVLEAHGEGVMTSQVFPGSPAAEAGLLPGDIIVGANGVDFKGMNWQESASLLKGESGTLVDLRYCRGTEILTARIERRAVRIPQVTGEVVDTVGCIQVSSFGLGMEKEFEETVIALRQQGAKSWIIDLRDNGGGLVDSALEMLGFFIGGQEAVIWQTSTEKSSERALNQTLTIDEPVIILANNMTASASEIVIGALHDYNKATVLGEKTYGSGRFKQIYALSNGDYFMMTITNFFTPKEQPVDFVGLAPDIQLSEKDALAVAKLLLRSGPVKSGEAATGYLQWQVGAQAFHVSLDEWRKEENWHAGQELIDQCFGMVTASAGNAQGWQLMGEEDLATRWPVYFPGYQLLCKQDMAQSGSTLVKASLPDGFWQNAGQFELVDASNGQRIGVSCQEHELGLEMIPQQSPSPNQVYWLVASEGNGQGFIAVLESGETDTIEGFDVDLRTINLETNLL